MMANLKRFIDAQDLVYASVLAELQAGKKETHRMWYIFPQLQILGNSETSKYFGIKDSDEAIEYLDNPLLFARLTECMEIVRYKSVDRRNLIRYILGPDASKLVSSATLFSRVAINADRVRFATFIQLCQELLQEAFDQGLSPCKVTQKFITLKALDPDQLTASEYTLYQHNMTLLNEKLREFSSLINYPPFILTSHRELRKRFSDLAKTTMQKEGIVLRSTLVERYRPLRNVEKELATELATARKYESDSNNESSVALDMYVSDYGQASVSDDDYHNHTDIFDG